MLPASRLPTQIISAIECAPVPPVPQVLLKLLDAVNQEDVSVRTLSELISRDPVITARVLGAANSAAFRTHREFIQIRDCVQVLGIGIIRTIATCLAIQQSFDPLSRQLQSELSGFWYHSLCVAETARTLAAETHLASPDEAYLAGLLHDVGELLLLYSLPEYAEMLSTCSGENQLPELEQLLFGGGHAATGAWLIDRWRLDSTLADAILFHHCPDDEIAQVDPLSRLLWVAHGWIETGKLTDAAAHLLDDDRNELESTLITIRERVDQIALALGIAIATDSAGKPSALPVIAYKNTHSVPSRVDRVARDLALMQSLREALADSSDETGLLVALRQAAHILFGLDRLAFLTCDADNNTLRGANTTGQPRTLRQLAWPISSARGLIATAMREDRVCHSAPVNIEVSHPVEASPTDLQLMRALDSDALICLPLRSNTRKIGVLAIGLHHEKPNDAHPFIDTRMEWLIGFSRLAGQSLGKLRHQQKIDADKVAVLTDHHVRQARQIAHEARNPLGIIRNYLTLIERTLPSTNPVSKELAIIDEEIGRVTQILERMGAPIMSAPEETGLNTIIHDMLTLYQPALLTPHAIEVRLDLVDGPVRFIGCVDAVKQILLNLLKNSAEAMPDGGLVQISTSAAAYQDGCRFVELRFSDNGPGLPRHIAATLGTEDTPVQPLTAATGLRGHGLTIISHLVAQIRGKLTFSNRPGIGVSFDILIPADSSDHSFSSENP